MLTLFGGCTNDDDYNNGTGSVDKGDAVQLTLELSVPGVSSPTYALSDVDENTLKEIDILVFKYNGENVDETYLYRTHATDIVNNTNGITTSKKFKAMLQKSTGSDKHRIVLIANARDAVDHAIRAVEEDLESGVVQMTKAEVLARIKFDTNRKWVTNSSEDFDPIPMWGETAATYTITATTTGVTLGAIRLLRSVARIDVGLDMENDYANGFGDRFKMEVVKVYNANGKSLVAPYAGNVQNRKATLPSLVEGISPMQEPIEYKHTPADFGFIREIYVGEARNKEQEGETLDDNDRCFIIIGGYYSKDGDPINETDLSWYRIDFYLRATGGEDAKPQERLDVLRNHRYKVNITKIDGPGYKNETDAVNSRPINMQTIVEAWDEGDMNDSNTDGQYQLVVNKSEFTLFKEGGANNPQKLKIYTDHPGGWRIEIPNSEPEDCSWINVSIDNDQSLTTVEVDITATAYPGLTESRTGYFYIYAGTMKKKIHVTQLNEAELSIVVTPNVLTFRKSAAQPKSITVTTYPEDAKVFLSKAEGDNSIGWIDENNSNGFPSSGFPATTFSFKPAKNNRDRLLSTVVTVTVEHPETGRLVPANVTIYQDNTDFIFEPFNFNTPYSAQPGTYSFKVNSDLPWRIKEVSHPAYFNGEIDDDLKEPGTDLEYSFTLLGNNSWANREIVFTPASENEPDFSGREFAITQKFVAPNLTLSKTLHDFGNTKSPTPLVINVSSNAKWKYTTEAGWSAVGSADLIATNTYGEHKYYNNPINTTIEITPTEYPAGDGTLPAGWEYTKKLKFETTDHGGNAGPSVHSQEITLKRAIPAHFNFKSISHTSIGRKGRTITATVETNAFWKVAPESGKGEASVIKERANWSIQTAEFKIGENKEWAPGTTAVNRKVRVNATYGITNDPREDGSYIEVTQPGYFISKVEKVSPGTLSATSNNNTSIKISGAAPDINVRVGYYEGATFKVLSTGTVLAHESDVVKESGNLNVGPNESWTSRDVVWQYEDPRKTDNKWTDFDKKTQAAAYSVTATVTQKVTSGVGGDAIIKISGYRPKMRLKITGASGGNKVPTTAQGGDINASTTGAETREISIPMNTLEETRNLIAYYEKGYGTENWVQIASWTQDKVPYVISNSMYVSKTVIPDGKYTYQQIYDGTACKILMGEAGWYIPTNSSAGLPAHNYGWTLEGYIYDITTRNGAEIYQLTSSGNVSAGGPWHKSATATYNSTLGGVSGLLGDKVHFRCIKNIP